MWSLVIRLGLGCATSLDDADSAVAPVPRRQPCTALTRQSLGLSLCPSRSSGCASHGLDGTMLEAARQAQWLRKVMPKLELEDPGLIAS